MHGTDGSCVPLFERTSDYSALFQLWFLRCKPTCLPPHQPERWDPIHAGVTTVASTPSSLPTAAAGRPLPPTRASNPTRRHGGLDPTLPTVVFSDLCNTQPKPCPTPGGRARRRSSCPPPSRSFGFHVSCSRCGRAISMCACHSRDRYCCLRLRHRMMPVMCDRGFEP